MNSNHFETFEEFLSKSFAVGVYVRELRLSREEAGYILKKYPKASMKKCQEAASSDGKCWYEINLAPLISVSNDRETIQHENIRLKKEIEVLKRSLIPVK